MKRVKDHRHKLYYQRSIANEPPLAKYLSVLVKNDEGYSAVVDQIKALVLAGW